MSIQAIVAQYQPNNIAEIWKQYKALQSKYEKFSRITFKNTPWWVGEIGEEHIEKDYMCAKGLTALAILNGPTDIEELTSAYKEIKSGFKEKNVNGYDSKKAQHPFSFFRGTIFHEYLNPNSEKCWDKDFAKKIIKSDVSLRDTNFGKWVMKKLGVEETGEVLTTTVEDISSTKDNPIYVEAKIFKTKNTFGDLTVRALSRTPKYSTYALGILGAIHTAYKVAQGGDVMEETAKSALEVGTTIAAMGYLGAIGAKHLRTVGSLTGMGLGGLVGSYVSEKLFSQFDSKTI